MKLIEDFYNVSLQALHKEYFPYVKYYRDDVNCAKMHYQLELFNNGCLTYNNLIKKLSIYCNDTKENIEIILSDFLTF